MVIAKAEEHVQEFLEEDRATFDFTIYGTEDLRILNKERNDYCKRTQYARKTREIREKFEHIVICDPEKTSSLSISSHLIEYSFFAYFECFAGYLNQPTQYPFRSLLAHSSFFSFLEKIFQTLLSIS